MPLMHAASCGFEAARSVRNVADLRRCLHGHSFLCSVRWADGAPDMGAALSTALAPLDYADLNQAVAVPDDASLLGWIAGHLPHADGLWLRSAPDRGVCAPAPRRRCCTGCTPTSKPPTSCPMCRPATSAAACTAMALA